MGVVKYTGPVASFHCPTNAEIRSLKVHFSPKQEGSGDPSPENVREIVGWDGVEVYNYIKTDVNTTIIPSEYKKVEYLESTGAQWIDTGIVPDNTTQVETLVETTVTVQDTPVFGVFVDDNSAGLASIPNYYHLTPYSNKWYFGQSGTEGNGGTYSRTIGEKHHVLFNTESHGIYINDASIVDNKTFSSVYGYHLAIGFRGHVQSNSHRRFGRWKYYYFKISNNETGELVHNLIPCIRKSDNKPGMYDTVSQTFYINAGTGEFLYGPEVNGYTTNYEFDVLGKNKFNWNVPVSESSPVGSNPSTAREFTLDTYVIGMSVNNYYRQNYTNWVLNPSVENGVVSFSSGGASGYGIAFPLKLAAGQTYFLSGTGDGSVGATYYDGNGELISYQNDRLNKTITVPENTATTLIGFYASTSNTEFTFSNIQLELGSTTTAYEPYDPNHTMYGGWVDLISGEVCEEWKLFDLTALTLTQFSVGQSVLTISAFPGAIKSRNAMFCNFLPPRSNPNISGVEGVDWNNSRMNMCLSVNRDLDTQAKVEQWLADMKTGGTTPTIVANMATSNTYHIAPTELQTFLGQNNVWSNADYIEVEYDLHETQTILARKQFIIANQPHIVKPAAASLQNFKTDLVAPLKECKVYFSPVQDLHGYDSPWVGGAGKNLLDMADENIVIGKYISNSGAITDNSNNFYNSKYIPVKPNTAYTLSTSTAISYCSFMEYDENKEFITRTLFGKSTPAITNETITTTGNTAYILIGSNVKYSTLSLGDVKAISWQFEQGTSVTTYEPYENVCPISGWTGVEVYRTGKNICDTPSSADILTDWELYSSGYNKQIAGLPAGQRFTLQANITKDLGENISNTRFYLNGKRTSGVFFNTGTPLGIHTTNNEVDDDGTLRLYHNMLGLTNYGAEFNNIQLELGSVATTYEPYSGTTLPITFPSEAGTVYGGYVDLVSGEVWKNCLFIVFDGSNDEPWLANGTDGYYYNKTITDEASPGVLMCSHYNAVSNRTTRTMSEGDCAMNALGQLFQIFDTSVSTNVEFKSKLSADPISVLLELATPQLVATLTPTQLKTLRGTNNIWANTSNGNIELAYWSH